MTLVKSVVLLDFSVLDVGAVVLTIVPITITVRMITIQSEQASQSLFSCIFHLSKVCLMCGCLR